MRTTLIGIIATLGIALTFSFSIPSSESFAFDQDLTTSELRMKLERDIRQDPQASYRAFKERYQSEKFEIMHGAAHLFEEILYEVAGAENILVCDSDLNFGCFHGFVRAAVSATGLEAVVPLTAICATLGDQGAVVCEHSIGHGILEYVGHDRLASALEVCADLPQADPLVGCSGGVFMEYNVPFSLSEQGEFLISARPLLDPENPYAPCDTLSSAAFAQSCYHELPQWWKQVYPEDYAQFGRYCEALPEKENYQACIRGIAKVIPQTANYDVERSAALCAKLPDEEAYGDCIVGAAWAIRANERDHERARALCAFAPDYKKDECPT